MKNDPAHFAFGRNWQNFSRLLDEKGIARAEGSLREMLGVSDLRGRSFLDIGCGSGLFSFCALRLGAAKVRSFDYDAHSVAAAEALKEKFFHAAPQWTIERGDALDREYIASLGKYDIVYSWGVLHHTGQMWAALEKAIVPVKDGGTLLLALYNDQGRKSRYWKLVKQLYNRAPGPLKYLVLLPCFVRIWGPAFIRDLLALRPFKAWRAYQENRGMSAWHDVVDWVGGYPFEVAKPEAVVDFYRQRGFVLRKIKTCGGGYGNNEFLFIREK